MLSELDEAIRLLLVNQGALDPGEIDIRFEIPDREWSATISKPTINCYLYDIHENRQLRGTEWWTERANATSARISRNPWRIDVSYVITAWTKAVEDEHRLLWHVLATLFRNPVLPDEYLQGPLQGTDIPILTAVGQPESTLRSPGEFWSALDNKLKPSLNYIVTLPLDQQWSRTERLALNRDVRSRSIPNDPPPGMVDVTGIVRGSQGKGVIAARVFFTGSNRAVMTDRNGRYIFRGVPNGKHTIAIDLPGQAPIERDLYVPAESYDLDISD